MSYEEDTTALRAQIAIVDREREREAALRDVIVARHCKIRVGDIMNVPSEAYSHRGKMCLVTHVKLTGRWGEWKRPCFYILACVLKNDHSPSTRNVHWEINLKDHDDESEEPK